MKILSILIVCMLTGVMAHPQKLIGLPPGNDTTWHEAFDKSNVLEIYTGTYRSHLNISNEHDRKKNFRMVANSSAYAGMYLSYKWLSLTLSLALPGTKLDNHAHLKYTSLDFNFGTDRFYFHPFYSSSNGLLLPENKRKDSFLVFRDMRFANAGLDLFYFSNTHHFSFPAAHSFSEKQTKSAGSAFLMLTPIWQRLSWATPSRDLITNSATYELLRSNPQWISLIGRVGYIYNFACDKGKWYIVPAFLVGSGLRRETNTDNRRLKTLYDFQGWVNAGYSGDRYYVYGSAFWDSLNTNLLIQNLNQVNTDFSITAGLRFHNASKRFLKVL